jgi:hypothetical protein
MELFISWSGERSKTFAQKLAQWIPDVIQSVKPFVSADDIEKGARWSTVIAERLEKADFGIICITRDTIDSRWLNFEGGALSRRFGAEVDTPVATLLLDISNPSDVPQPLGQFNATVASDGDDMRKLLGAINARAGEASLDPERLDRAFTKEWPSLLPHVEEVCAQPVAAESEAEADNTSKLNEILSILRQMERSGATIPRLQSVGTTRSTTWKVEEATPRDRFTAAVLIWAVMNEVTPPTIAWSDQGQPIFTFAEQPNEKQIGELIETTRQILGRGTFLIAEATGSGT